MLRSVAVALAALASLAAVLFALPSRDAAPPTAVPAAAPDAAMVEAAAAFLSSLDDAHRARATYAFDDDERFDWHFVPRTRNGLPLKDMTAAQRIAAHDLLRSALSSQGYLKTTGIMALENVLRALEGDPVRRDPENYSVTVFGTPGEAPWGWRFEGHHVSLHFSTATGRVAATPAFLGTNPAEVRTGPTAGTRVLGAEEDLGRALVRSLTPAQRARAVLSDVAPREVVTGADRRVGLETYDGLAAADMTEEQRALLWRIVEQYVGNLAHDLAHAHLDRIRRAGTDSLHFAWAGSLARNEGHYYRIHGPAVLLEYDNVQNDDNHAHAVWRTPDGDFGEDLLRLHYETAAPGHGH